MKARTSKKETYNPKEKVEITREHLEYFQDGIRSRDKKISELREGVREVSLTMKTVLLEMALKYGDRSEDGSVSLELPIPNKDNLKKYTVETVRTEDGKYVVTAAPAVDEE